MSHPTELNGAKHLRALNDFFRAHASQYCLNESSDSDALRAHFATLEEVDLSDCELTELPEEIRLLTNLKHLQLECNALSTLPDTKRTAHVA